MTIKSLLIGSAAAIVAASSAQAADAIVAADPEPVEYVQVCDTYGDGYFYIPGTETCLKFSGYVQFQTTIDDDADDAEHGVEARLQIDAKNDSEIGTIASTIRLTNDGAHNPVPSAFNVDRAYMTIGDGNYWTVGLAGNPWDFSIVGEQNFLDSGSTRVLVGYTMAFDGGSFSLYAIDDLAGDNSTPDFVAKLDFTAGDLGVVAAYAYAEDTAQNSSVKVNLSYMGFGAHAQWSEDGAGAVDYLAAYEWVLGVGYGFDATDRLNIALAADYAMDMAGVSGTDDYAVSANFTYQVAEGLEAAARLTHINGDSYASASNELRLRLKRSF
ncbi:MAG: porin [Lentilitoribacter sp.]